jgi:hypothetical protein
MWLDLYTLSVRVETLGHGVYANKGYEPNFNTEQLSDALVRVLRDRPGEEGYSIRMKALELSRPCKAVRGDRRAADAILAAAKKEPLDQWFS